MDSFHLKVMNTGTNVKSHSSHRSCPRVTRCRSSAAEKSAKDVIFFPYHLPPALRDDGSAQVLAWNSVSNVCRVGYVPEHFLTPLLLAHKHNLFSPAIHPVPCPSGTGQMLERLKNKEIGKITLIEI